MPVLERDALAGECVGEQGRDAFLAVRRELEGLRRGVDQPSQDGFDGVPGSVARAKLLDGRRFARLWVSERRLQNLVDGVEEDPPNRCAAMPWALAQGDVVVHEDVDMGEGLREAHVRGRQRRSREGRLGCRAEAFLAGRLGALRGRHGDFSVGSFLSRLVGPEGR